MAEASKKYEECTADRDKVNKEVERLREELAKAAMQSVQLEKSRLRLEAKTEEVSTSSECNFFFIRLVVGMSAVSERGLRLMR